MIARRPKPVRSFAARSERGRSNEGRLEPKGAQNAKRKYERYLALARAEALVGNTVGAENYNQYAEHYYRSMFSDPEATQKLPRSRLMTRWHLRQRYSRASSLSRTTRS